MKYAMIGLALFMITFGSWAGTFMDDFDDGNMDGWTPLAFGVGGTWKVENKELAFQSDSAGDFIVLTGDNSWEDYIIEVKLMVPEAVGNTSKLAGITFRVSGSGSYTVGLMNQVMASYYFNFANGVINFQSVPFDWELGIWYNLKAVIEEDHFKYYVNDELIMEYTDSSGSKGQAGLQASGAIAAYFDDFIITGDDIPGNVTAVSSKTKMTSKWGKIKQSK